MKNFEKLQHLIDTLLVMSDRVRIELENADIASARAPLVTSELSHLELSALRRDITATIDRIDRLLAIDRDLSPEESIAMAQKLSGFLDNSTLIPHAETKVEAILGKSVKENMEGVLPQPTELEPRIEQRKATREPSAQAIGNISGRSISDDNWMLTYDDGPHL